MLDEGLAFRNQIEAQPRVPFLSDGLAGSEDHLFRRVRDRLQFLLLEASEQRYVLEHVVSRWLLVLSSIHTWMKCRSLLKFTCSGLAKSESPLASNRWLPDLREFNRRGAWKNARPSICKRFPCALTWDFE